MTSPPTATAPAPTLSGREREVLEGMARGHTNGEIGRALYLSEDTVKSHCARLFRKLDARDRTHAVVRGIQLGFLRVDGPDHATPPTLGQPPARTPAGPSVELHADDHDAALLARVIFGPNPANPDIAHGRALDALRRLVGGA